MLDRLLGRLVSNAVAEQVAGSGIPLPMPLAHGALRLLTPGSLRHPARLLRPGNALLGLGVLGAAYAAYRHFSQSDAGGNPAAEPSTGAPPSPGGGPERDARTLLLLRTMIAAASADAEVDATERQALGAGVSAAGLPPTEASVLETELARPWTPAALAALTPPEMTGEVFAAALLAIDVDTEAERRWLEQLRLALGLDEAAARELAARLGKA